MSLKHALYSLALVALLTSCEESEPSFNVRNCQLNRSYTEILDVSFSASIPAGYLLKAKVGVAVANAGTDPKTNPLFVSYISPKAGRQVYNVSVVDLEQSTSYSVVPFVEYDGTEYGNVISASTAVPLPMDYVDLGLPSGNLWATKNVGATAPELVGNYYEWAELETREKYGYSGDNRYCDGGKVLKYTKEDGLEILESCDDVATQLYGKGCRIPNKDDVSELRSCCKAELLYNYNGTGKNVIKITSSKNSNFIIIPTSTRALTLSDSDFSQSTSQTYLWMANLQFSEQNAYSFSIAGSAISIDWENRWYGLQIRPVKSK